MNNNAINGRFCSAIKKGYLIKNDKHWRHSFIGSYVLKYPKRMRVLDIFSEILGHRPEWADLTDDNLKDLRMILRERMCESSLKTILAEFKSLINENINAHKIPSHDYLKILYAKGETSQSTYLTEEEVRRIFRYVPLNKTEEAARRLFLIQCFTGARISDAKALSQSNIYRDTLRYVQIKTKKEVILPVHNGLSSLLTEGNHANPTIGRMNDALRQICQCCHINQRLTLFRHGEYITDEKWQFITSHCGRKSFATNLYLRGVDILTISRLMGHSDVKMTERYIVDYSYISPKAMGFFRQKM